MDIVDLHYHAVLGNSILYLFTSHAINFHFSTDTHAHTQTHKHQNWFTDKKYVVLVAYTQRTPAAPITITIIINNFLIHLMVIISKWMIYTFYANEFIYLYFKWVCACTLHFWHQILYGICRPEWVWKMRLNKMLTGLHIHIIVCHGHALVKFTHTHK